ncbi:MAG: putative membrane protein [Polaribacter sp.]|jgi:putative membrane protein
MEIASKVVIALVAVLHIYILWLEMFAWTTKGRKVFKTIPQDMFEPTKVMAANQGLYNGFLAAGLIWSLLITDPEWSWNVGFFFLACVLVAANYGAYSVSWSIFKTQGVPALIGIVLLLLSM